MKLNKSVSDEILELIESVFEDDTHLQQLLSSSEPDTFYTKEELQKTIDEISSSEMKLVFEKKLTNFESDRKRYLMEKYGKPLLNGRLVRSILDIDHNKSNHFLQLPYMKKKYTMFKKYY